jgi:hypothetical protein
VLVDAIIGYEENVDSGCHANVHPARTSSDQRLPPTAGTASSPPSVRMVGPDGSGQPPADIRRLSPSPKAGLVVGRVSDGWGFLSPKH